MSRLHSMFLGLAALALLAAPNTDLADCGNAADHYAATVTAVVNALRSYEKCIARSDQKDDCAAQMQALDNAHDNFADAVADAKGCK